MAGTPPSPTNPSERLGTSPRDRRFFIALVAPLVFYFAIVLAILLADVLYVSWEGPRRFWAAVTKPEILFALKLSFITSTLTMILSLVIAIPAGYVLSRRRFFGRAFVDTVLDIPIVLPPLVVGYSLLIVFASPPGKWFESHVLEFVFRPAGIVLAQFVVACAFAVRTMKATFDQIDPRTESVARTLGFGPLRAFLVGTLPLARSGIVAAAVITWARAVGEFGPILVLCGTTSFSTEVLPTSIYLQATVGDLHAAMAISLMMIATSVALLVIVKRFGGKTYLS